MKKITCIIILLLYIFVMAACGEKSSAVKLFEIESTDQTANCNVYVVSINPQAAIYEDARTYKVVNIVMLNDDAKEHYAELSFEGKSVSDVVNDMVDLCVEKNLINEENKDVNIVVAKYHENNEEHLETEVQKIRDSVSQNHGEGIIVNESKADVTNEDGDDVNITSQEIWIECPDCEGGMANCTHCNGDWETGVYIPAEACRECGGSGDIVWIEEREEEVRNDYVCPVCGGKGWLDDGMHGGKTAECGHCTTNGGNRDFNDLAYDKVIVEEEMHEVCGSCNGTGIGNEERYEACYYCSNGKVQCPTCNGSGGWMISN